jgi:diguanylate cyclase (GGDEF)-like protein/PAS domain S-box-containing protein
MPLIENSDLMYRQLIQSVVDYAIYMLTPEGVVANWNPGAERAKGYKAHEIVGKHFSTFYSQQDRAAGLPEKGLAVAGTTGQFETEGWRQRKDGTSFWAHVVIDAIYDEDRQLIGFAKVTRDISERRRQEQELIKAKELAEQYSQEMASVSDFLDSVISNIPASVIVYDTATRKIRVANQQAERLFGGRQACMVGRRLHEGLQPEVADYMMHQVDRGLGYPGVQLAETQVMTAAGVRTLRSRTLLCEHLESESGYVLFVAEDVTDELAAHAQIHHMAHHDGLTGLPNRNLFNDRLAQALERDQQDDKMTGVLCLDLDNFKNINDALGHAFGDKLLLALGKRLRRELRDQDTLARLGGDEFAIVLSAIENLDAARCTAQRLINAITAPFSIEGHALTVGASIGIAIAPDDHNCAQQLLGYADMALYEAKRNGRNRHECFRHELDEAARSRRVIETELRTALRLGQLHLHYQPIIDTHGKHISGYEALMRWEHPDKGLIMPLDFISIAEETGLIHEVGALALKLACREAASWGTEQSVAVNLSPIQFKKIGLVETVIHALKESGLAAGRLELEITESVLLDNTDENIRTLRALKDLGICISLDDFGTGYSSLGYLRSFPFDRIKIDKSFIRDMGKSQEALSIIRAITGMSNSLSIKTTAEGVETHEQQLQLEAEGCSHVQGYLFGHPMAPTERLKEMPVADGPQCRTSTGTWTEGSPSP